MIVLKISVGLYTGDLEINDELITSFTADTVDSILATGKYTMTIEMELDGEDYEPTIEVNGAEMAFTITVNYGIIPVKAIFLVKDEKTYAVIPMAKMYFDTDEDYSGIVSSQKNEKTYLKSEYVTIDNVKYVCESFKTSDGQLLNYYFLDGKWKIFETEAGNPESRQKIVSLTAGVNASSFDISGYKYGGTLPEN